MSHPSGPPPPPTYPDGWSAASPAAVGPVPRQPVPLVPVSAGGWIRWVAALVSGLVTVALLAGVMTTLVAGWVLSDTSRPGRLVVVALAVPQVREGLAQDLTRSLTESLEREGVRPDPTQEWVLRRAAEAALARPETSRALLEVRITDTDLDLRPVGAVISEELREHARTSAPEQRAVLVRVADDLDAGGGRDRLLVPLDDTAGSLAAGRTGLRTLLVLGSLLPLGVATITGALALVLARRTGLTAALVVSGTLVATALLLRPDAWLVDLSAGTPSDVLRALAAVGGIVGPVVPWVLAGTAVLPLLWWWWRSRPGPGAQPAGVPMGTTRHD